MDLGLELMKMLKFALNMKRLLVQQMVTIPVRERSARLTCDYNATSVQLQLQLPTGTELGNIRIKQTSVLFCKYLTNEILCGGQLLSC